MSTHDRLAVHEFIHAWWFNYDEGYLDRLEPLLADDCRVSSRTERGDHPHERFIASDSRGRDAAFAWIKDHRRHSPYPLRHNGTNIFVAAERGDEVDVESYLFVTRIDERRPATLSSGLVHWTLRRTANGYQVVKKDTVLDSIESAPFETVPEVSGRIANW